MASLKENSSSPAYPAPSTALRTESCLIPNTVLIVLVTVTSATVSESTVTMASSTL